MRPIDADDLVEKIYEIDRKYGMGAFGDGLEMAKELVLNSPTVELDRPHGEWKYEPKLRLVDETDDGAIYETAMKCFCSACGADFGFQKVDDAFCKYCGSDNRKREGDENVN